MSVIEVDRVRSGYGKHQVLHDVSLRVERDEIVAIVGPNGAGKSTLMKTIFRLLPVLTGAVAFNGRDLTRFQSRELASLGMGYVPQEGNTFPELSVDDNLSVSLAGTSRQESKTRRESVYERFPALAERRRQAAGMLSGGERQMLALGSAMITSPSFLALDEPTTGLAPSIVEDLVGQIREFRHRGTGILWVIEDNPLQVLDHVDRVYIMGAGAVEREVGARELLADRSLRDMFFGTAGKTDTGDADSVPDRVNQDHT